MVNVLIPLVAQTTVTSIISCNFGRDNKLSMQTWKIKETWQSTYVSRHRVPARQSRYTLQPLMCTYYTGHCQINMVKRCVDILYCSRVQQPQHNSTIKDLHSQQTYLLTAFLQLKIAVLQSKLKFLGQPVCTKTCRSPGIV